MYTAVRTPHTDATARIVSSGYQDGLEELDAARDRFANESWYDLVQGEYTGTLMADWARGTLGTQYGTAQRSED